MFGWTPLPFDQISRNGGSVVSNIIGQSKPIIDPMEAIVHSAQDRSSYLVSTTWQQRIRSWLQKQMVGIRPLSERVVRANDYGWDHASINGSQKLKTEQQEQQEQPVHSALDKKFWQDSMT
jgi:hypothetical protein